MNMQEWRARMLRVHGTEYPEPPYIVFHAPGHSTGHGTLATAWLAADKRGGVVYERIGTTAARKAVVKRAKRQGENGEEKT